MSYSQIASDLCEHEAIKAYNMRAKMNLYEKIKQSLIDAEKKGLNEAIRICEEDAAQYKDGGTIGRNLCFATARVISAGIKSSIAKLNLPQT